MVDPEKNLIHPDFAFEHAWNYQVLLSDLQLEINNVINEMQTLVSDILKTSTAETLTQYQTHITAVQAEYVPMLGLFNSLTPGTCRSQAESILNTTTTFTGYDASNCANVYDQRVRNELATANRALVRFDDIYSQVQTIVVKAFIAQNAFLTPEDIRDEITNIYGVVQGRWSVSKPEMEAVKRALQTNIAQQNVVLGNCHNNVLSNAVTMFGMFRSMVQTCADFENTAPAAFSSKMSHSDIYEEFQAFIAQRVPFVWE